MASSSLGVSAAKTALRKRIRSKLQALDEAELLRQSEAVCERLVKSPWFVASHSIGIFLSMPKGELRTEPILRHAFTQGKRVYCPRVMGEGWMELFEVKSFDEASNLPLSKWRIPEPPESSPKADPTELDLLLVPAVALDLARRRCGHGCGFYDRYIQRARNRSEKGSLKIRTVGIGLSEQCEDEVPLEDHDELLDAVIFPHSEAFASEEE
eukprot:TRINITY_DN7705_c3_g1_i1.p1 TRINITY_DN7705_c3_g1~~TRINITY_DN7705_c3_g1_i1.p1  ORF type:complete len:211 (+),score=39.45 TRINITY_DN7705_c3_g1_i1:86-718(+)